MKLHEYQAKQLLLNYGLPVPTGYTCKTAKEVEEATIKLGNSPWIAKCQIHAGGRCKAGGIKVFNNLDEIRLFAKKWLGNRLVTYQTDSNGQLVNQILVEEAVTNVDKELYLGVVIDRTFCRVIFIASTEGGVEIEKVAVKRPDLIHKAIIDPLTGPMPYQGRDLAFKVGLSGKKVQQFTKIFIGLSRIFFERDLTLIEINPLVVTEEGNLICLDSKFNVDSNALYRQVELKKMYDLSQKDPYESYASELELKYVALDGNIGCIVNGAGLAMETMDMLKLCGGAPANFLDVGGGITRKRITEAFKLILSNKNVKAILVNIFGGIVRCDLIANGIIVAVREIGATVPVITRFEGNNAELGVQKLVDSGLKITVVTSLTDAAKKAVEAAKVNK